jgi:hypothetical protein
VWYGWGGFNATRFSELQIVYKGLLPEHQMNLSFFYGYAFDSTKNIENHGDGVGLLPASPDEWSTVTITIPDSVDMNGITGIAFAIENAPDQGDTAGGSEVGNLKMARITVMSPADPVKHKVSHTITVDNRTNFMPSPGSGVLTVHSLKGEMLERKTVTVQPGKMYSVHRFVKDNCGAAAPQLRFVTISGKGVRVSRRVW